MHGARELQSISTQKTSDDTPQKVVLVLSGAFDPPTYMHFRMFERARDFLEKTLGFEVVEGVVSLCSDQHAASDMATTHHRLQMVELLAAKTSWVRVDQWESEQRQQTGIVHVLRRIHDQMRQKKTSESFRVMLLCGGDVMDSFAKGNPAADRGGVTEIVELVRDHGMVVMTRANSNPLKVIYMVDALREFQKNIYVIEDETFASSLSSTRLRTATRRGESIKFCTSDEVISYIAQFRLYLPEKSLENGSKPSTSALNPSTDVDKPDERISALSKVVEQFAEIEKELSNEPIWKDQANPSCSSKSARSSTNAISPRGILSPKRSEPSETTEHILALESPIYDNVSLEEILKVSNNWNEYIRSVAQKTSTPVLEQLRLSEEHLRQPRKLAKPKSCENRGVQCVLTSPLPSVEFPQESKKLIRFNLNEDGSQRRRKSAELLQNVPLSSSPQIQSFNAPSLLSSPRQLGIPSDSAITLTYADCSLDSNTPETTV
ncbi:hypothetical protein L596_003654 [Steinernema carpocapsae]|uniref:Cytidyltransferase-like domain-containing protein n=1 Tax=Steinernema carpocapsae TaxID=34508 RepID=A0A4U8UWG7_STECR|nr:hypothetical protein L596_003654 [Steinernema carpocapsae]